MTMPPLPSQGSTSWYSWATAAHDAAAQVIEGRLTEEALRAAFAARDANAYNVLQGDHPLGLRNAIADGVSHPLSYRFPTLAAAQAVFPRATALTEEYDRHAIQWGLDHYGHVYGPGGRTYMVDNTLYTSAADTDRGLGNQILEIFGTLKLRDGPNACVLASGNSRTAGVTGNKTAAEAPATDNLTIRIACLDGNAAFVTGGNVPGLYMRYCNNLDLDVYVQNVKGDGVQVVGVSDEYTRVTNLRRVYVTGCTGGYGLRVDLRNRQVTYNDVKAWSNAGTGVFWDHSESNSNSIMAWDNGEHGIYVRNQSRNNIRGLRATGNQKHGILVSGSSNCVGGDWISTDNGLASVAGVAEYADLYFDNVSGSYGVTASSRFHNIMLGRQINEVTTGGWCLYVEDGVTGDLSITGVKLAKLHGLGAVRVPAAPGSLRVEYATNNSTTTTIAAGASPTGLASKLLAANHTINNSAVLAALNDLTLSIGAQETWLVTWLLYVQSGTTPDIQFGLSYPTPMQGRWGSEVGLVTAQTGGSGDAKPNAGALTTTITLGTTTNPITVVRLSALLKAGALSGAGTVALTFAQAVADASDTTIMSYSSLIAQRIA